MVKLIHLPTLTVKTDDLKDGSLRAKVKLARFGDTFHDGLLLTNGLSRSSFGTKGLPVAQFMIPLRSFSPLTAGDQVFAYATRRESGVLIPFRSDLDIDALSPNERRFIACLLEQMSGATFEFRPVALHTITREFYSDDLAKKYIREPVCAAFVQLVFSFQETQDLGINPHDAFVGGSVPLTHFSRTEI